MQIPSLFTKWFSKQNIVLREEISVLRKQNTDLKIDKEILNEEINVLKIKNEDLQIDNEIFNEEIKTYMNKIADIKNGNLILINEEEKKKLEKKIEKLEKAYDSLQKMLSEEESLSGICYDGLSDYYYEKYYTIIEAFKNALKDNFHLNIELPSVEEIEKLNRSKQNELIEEAIRLGRYC